MQHAYSRVEVAERITSEEFLRRAPEDQKAELIDGVMIVAPPPLDIHERLVLFLLRLLGEFVERRDLGELRGSRTAVLLADDQTYEPDLLFVSHERAHVIHETGVFGAPDLVVEVLSASTAAYDRGTKLRAYDQAGVRELWLIDPYGPVGTEYCQRGEQGLRPVLPDAGGVVASIALPGFKLQTSWLWPDGKFIPVHEALARMNG
jgi:Uma2 family endonuclease